MDEIFLLLLEYLFTGLALGYLLERFIFNPHAWIRLRNRRRKVEHGLGLVFFHHGKVVEKEIDYAKDIESIEGRSYAPDIHKAVRLDSILINVFVDDNAIAADILQKPINLPAGELGFADPKEIEAALKLAIVQIMAEKSRGIEKALSDYKWFLYACIFLGVINAYLIYSQGGSLTTIANTCIQNLNVTQTLAAHFGVV